jgi:hypothetical protein
VRVVGGLLLVAIGVAGALAADRLFLEPATSDATTPAVPQSAPGPGDPPVVWVEGILEEVSDSQIVVREGEGPEVEVERLGQGATSFLTLDGSQWMELTDEQVAEVPAGGPACVETLLDGRTFLALRVFLGASCGPA